MERCHSGRRGRRRAALAIAGAGLLIVAVGGCSLSMPFTRNEFGPALPKDATVEAVVQRVNANISHIQSWRSSDVSISGPSLPVHLAGDIAVERPLNFRLRATALGMDEADFGSNTDRFWFWVKRAQAAGGKNYVYFARHEDVRQSDALRQFPFEPDWLMDALGIVPIDPKQVTMHTEEGGRMVNLICERLSPAGQMVKKVIRVDMRRGVVVGHSLHDANGNLIAKAQLDEYSIDKSGHKMPHKVTLEWPQAQMKISLAIGHIDVNPASMPRRMWDLPKKPYSPSFDLAARMPEGTHRATATAAAPPRKRIAIDDSAPDLDDTKPLTSVRTASHNDLPRTPPAKPTTDDEWATPMNAGNSPPNSTGRSASVSDPAPFDSSLSPPSSPPAAAPGAARSSTPSASSNSAKADPFAGDNSLFDAPASSTPPAVPAH